MVKVVRVASPAARAVLRQATALRPKRRTSSDGLLPSRAHIAQSPDSDHNLGLAADLSHDPKNGIDCRVIFEELKKDPRVKYLIHNGLIWSRARRKEGNRKYTGVNPHKLHLHISIEEGFAKDTSPWFPWMGTPRPINKVRAAVKRLPKKKEN